MTDKELTELIDITAASSGYGGLDSSTMYGQFALEVAKAVRERWRGLVQEALDADDSDNVLGKSLADKMRAALAA